MSPPKPPSLQVAVDFEAVVARVSHDHVSIRGQGQTLGSVQRVRRGVDVGEEGAAAVEHLEGFQPRENMSSK